MHGGELLGFIKKEHQQAKLVEVILAFEPGKQIDLRTLKDALSKVSGPHKEPPPEAAELLDDDSMIVSRALANSVMLPFLKPVIKSLIPLEFIRPITGTGYIFETDVPSRNLTLAVEDRLAGIPGLAGEWFVGKVDGIIMRSKKHEALSFRMGIIAQTPEKEECLTIFDLNNGFRTFKTIAEASIPIMYGDVLLADGTLDEKRLLIRARLIFLIRSREMWVLG